MPVIDIAGPPDPEMLGRQANTASSFAILARCPIARVRALRKFQVQLERALGRHEYHPSCLPAALDKAATSGQGYNRSDHWQLVDGQLQGAQDFQKYCRVPPF